MVLSVQVKANGRVGAVKVLRGVHPMLDRLAVKALRRARFKPARNAAGKNIAYLIPRYKYSFRLED